MHYQTSFKLRMPTQDAYDVVEQLVQQYSKWPFATYKNQPFHQPSHVFVQGIPCFQKGGIKA